MPKDWKDMTSAEKVETSHLQILRLEETLRIARGNTVALGMKVDEMSTLLTEVAKAVRVLEEDRKQKP